MVLGTQISTLYYIIYVSKGVKPYGKSPSHKQHFCFFPEFSVSRFVLETGNRNWGFCVFFQYSQSNVEIVFQIRLHLPLSIYFSFLFFTDHPFDAVCTPLNKEWFIKDKLSVAYWTTRIVDVLGSRGASSTLLASALVEGEWQVSCPGRLVRRYALKTRLNGLQNRSGRFGGEEIL